MEKQELTIGFIGQGFIGKNYANDFEKRGYNIVRYDIENYAHNKERIKECDIVLIAVPTPSTPEGFDDSILKEVLGLIGQGKIAVIKSTIQVGTTQKMQELYPEIIVMHSPEFLTEKTADYDAMHPNRNIVGILNTSDKELYQKAELVMSTLPPAPYSLITEADTAALIKYGGNCWFYFKVVFMNILYDLIQEKGVDFEVIKEAMSADPRIGPTHLSVLHQGGRGAGGHCFIKDFEAFIEMLDKQNLTDQKKTCEVLRDLNIKYLRDSGKNLELLKGVYGK